VKRVVEVRVIERGAGGDPFGLVTLVGLLVALAIRQLRLEAPAESGLLVVR
jgi:hypothetical protein